MKKYLVEIYTVTNDMGDTETTIKVVQAKDIWTTVYECVSEKTLFAIYELNCILDLS